MSSTETCPVSPKAQQSPVVVKKYANRRLYNTESSSYITLDNLAGMIRAGRDFVVYDAKTGEDITRGVLTQIIVEEESKGRAMLPTAFLRQIIGFYGDSLQQFVPSYLEQAMTSFALQQEQMRTAMQQTMGNLFPGMQDIGRQNMAMMERAMTLFAPFYRKGGAEPARQADVARRRVAPEPGHRRTAPRCRARSTCCASNWPRPGRSPTRRRTNGHAPNGTRRHEVKEPADPARSARPRRPGQ